MSNGSWRFLCIAPQEENFILLHNLMAQVEADRVELEGPVSLEAGLQALAQNEYDAVFVEAVPGSLIWVEQIREAYYPSSLPLILFSPTYQPETYLQALATGVDLFLPTAGLTPLLLEDALRKVMAGETTAEQKYRSLIHALDQGFCIIEVIFDDDGRPVDYLFLEVNPVFEAQTGIEEAVGKRVRQIAPGQEEFWFQVYGEIARTGIPQRFEHAAAQLGFYYEVFAFRVGPPSANQVAVFFLDITARKTTEAELMARTQELVRVNQILREITFTASHDLQEPLRKIKTFGKLLVDENGASLTPDGQNYLDRMVAATDRMSAMIRDLLDYYRLERDSERHTLVSLEQVAAEAVSDLEIRLLQTDGQVILRDLPTITADRVQMHRLFLNLIGNALKFHRPGVPPQVLVSGRMLPEGQVEISFEDNGIGFDPHEATRLFEPFGRQHPRRDYEGTGMGLAICRKIVEAHHGSITVSSAPGQGSTFTVIFPVGE